MFTTIAADTRGNNICQRMTSTLRQWGDMVLRQALHFAATVNTPMPIMRFDALPLCIGKVIDWRIMTASPAPGSLSSMQRRIAKAVLLLFPQHPLRSFARLARS